MNELEGFGDLSDEQLRELAREARGKLPPAPTPEEVRSGSRITVVEQLYFSTYGKQIIESTSRFQRQVQTKEQPFIRETILQGEDDPTPIELGWLKDTPVGMLKIENTTSLRDIYHTNVTPEQAADVSRRVIQIGILSRTAHDFGGGEDVFLPILDIPPGEDARFTPNAPGILMWRSLYGEAFVRLRAYPGG